MAESAHDRDDDATRILTRPPGPAADAAGAQHGGGTSGIFAPSGMTRAPADDAEGAHPDLLAIGTLVGEFRITRVVGQGGFGVVYEAWDHTLERVVAIKEYLPASLSARHPDGSIAPISERHRETFDLGMRSFINEARLLAQFDHPSLVKVYRFWQERGTTYMVMPFYRGDTLRHRLAAAKGAVDEQWLLTVMDGITQALGVMHAEHCYHRDIAPDNILLLEGSGRPVVLDFGAARRVITDQTQAMTVILKPGYAPIEQYAEMPDMRQGPWTDVYALAAVMHVAVRGHAPPPSVARMMGDSYVPVSGSDEARGKFSERLLAAIDAGLAVRPADRPQSMGALRALLGLDGGEAHPAATVPPMPPRAACIEDAPPTREAPRIGMAAGAVLGAAVLIGGAVWWWQGAKRDDAPAAARPATEESRTASPAPASGPAASPAAAPRPDRSPLDSLRALEAGANPGFVVTAKPKKSEVTIGKDRLSFDLRSSRDGFAYVYMLSSNGELFLMFPNLLDKYNKVAAGTTLTLPRASWPLDAGGPAGADEFVVLVSERERDLSASGLRNDGVFPQFSLPVLAALESARAGERTPLAGKPVCPGAGAPCEDVYGTAGFRIIEK